MPRSAEVPTRSARDVESLASAWDQLLYTIGGAPASDGIDHPEFKESSAKIPVTVLSGFLGAGKTTLLCALLEEHDGTLVAIVNDLAAVNIDATLVRETTAETVELANGCACCVLGNDLDAVLCDIATRDEPPDAIIIEASGISDPIGLAQTVANNGATVLDGIVTLVDATLVRAQMSDELVAPMLKRQLSAAHIVAISKISARDEVPALREALGEIVPGRPIVALDVARGQLQELVLGASLRGARPTPDIEFHDYKDVSSQVFQSQQFANADAFFALMTSIPESVYRIKGSLYLSEQVGLKKYRFQAVGPYWRVEAELNSSQQSQLVVIGRHADPTFDAFFAALSELFA